MSRGAPGVVGHGCALALAALIVLGCAERTGFSEQRLFAMGTWVDVTVGAPKRTADEALAEIEAGLRRFEVDYHAWADGELARLNDALAAGRDAEASVGMAVLLQRARALSGRSGGRFDPGIGALVELWGFHRPQDGRDRAPDESGIRAALATAGIRHVRIDGRRVSTAEPGVQIDLGGIAKGEAVDRIVDVLRRHGVRNALVNAGGDVRVLGTRHGRPWRIGVRDPRGDGVLGVIELADGQAAFTSGDYERQYEQDGQRMHHILDPRTGRPANASRAVTIVLDSGVDADAAATALFVAGEAWRETAAALGVAAVLRVAADGTVETTAAMRAQMPAGERTDGHADR